MSFYFRLIALAIMGSCTGAAHAQDESRNSGQTIYDSYCAACHGFDGVPILSDTPNFAKGERLEKSEAELLKAIMDGKGPMMPGWTGILTEPGCDEVVEFLKNTRWDEA